VKNFREQFVECRKNGFHGEGTPLNRTEDMPLLKKLSKEETAKLKQVCTVACLRFGGICHSGNEACVEMRSKL
jgi:hypothetical protein